ncbi:ATP-grasp domain-containing protein [Caldisalinibacter kiritimatiensis]|uniref:Ribosomal protein S6 glutaminyl transferase n=1 Tax=Caldisalinibacter kiritimatiensis TaxID=1304284 RepID=R1AST7_9FIRM|nr:ATP-grasp domain-containing protein [Caldisalinibacter kiritimatiensis]EOD00218.1 Ribosomal protein S6 glutaminyl transferase [Caldisalinibacter kiritimatiensis]
MKLVSFNPYRTIGIPGVKYIKPEHMFREIKTIKKADYILFPEYWQVNSLVYGLKKKIFPNINTFHLGHNKVEMTRALLATFPENVPYTRIMGKNRHSIEIIEEEFGYPCVAKEIKNSMGQGVFLIQKKQDLQRYIDNNDTLYIQEKLPIDRDLRVVYVGNKVVSAYWRIGKEGSFHNNVAKGGSYSFENIPLGAVDLVDKAAKTLGINHAGFDVVVVGDRYYILEFNVLFGNEALRHLGISIEKMIYDYILSDFKPNGPDKPTFPGVPTRKKIS